MITSNNLPLSEILAPGDAAAAAEGVRAAAKERTAVYPLGGGTQMHYGMPPTRPGVGISLEKMNRLVDYPADDMTVTVEAGMTFAALTQILAKNRQCLPVDVSQPEKATMGGLTAVNLSGPRRFGQGSLRDYLLGFAAVDGQGAIFSGGGRVVKNAAGHNLPRLMAGSRGTLGILTQLTFMVRPIPESAAVLACDVPDLPTAEKLLADFISSPVRPAAIDLVLGAARHQAPILGPKGAGAACFYAGFEGAAAETQWMLETLRGQWHASGITAISSVADDSVARFWQWQTDFPAEVLIRVLPSQVTRLLESIQKILPDCSLIAHAGHGEVRLAVGNAESGAQNPQPTGPSSAPAAEDERRMVEGGTSVHLLRERLRPLIASLGGTLTVLSCPTDAVLTREDLWGPRDDAFAVMQALKDRFDPLNILNPGRFIFEESDETAEV
jgi:glycolate oxidase FAD binding subunit